MIDLTNPRSLPLKAKRHVFVDERTGARVELDVSRDDPAEAAASRITNLLTEDDYNSLDARYKNQINAYMRRMLGSKGPLGMMLDIVDAVSPDADPIPDVPGILRVGPYVTWDMSLTGKNSQMMVNTLNSLLESAGDKAKPEDRELVAYFSDELERYIADFKSTGSEKEVDPIEQMIRDMFPGAQIMNLGGFKL